MGLNYNTIAAISERQDLADGSQPAFFTEIFIFLIVLTLQTFFDTISGLSVKNPSDGFLTDFPGCGKLGNPEHMECTWDCRWIDNPYFGKHGDVIIDAGTPQELKFPWYFPKLKNPKSLQCLSDCPIIQKCNNQIPGIANKADYLRCMLGTQETYNGIGRIVLEACIVAELVGVGCGGSFGSSSEDTLIESVVDDINKLRNVTRLFGDGLGYDPEGGPESTSHYTLNQYPMACSVRTRGYRGRHLCGSTMISAPPRQTILVSAAHCNYICKSRDGDVVETCCCRTEDNPATCITTSSHCGDTPTLQLAEPSDLQIVCGEWEIATIPEWRSVEDEVFMDVTKFTNHHKFDITTGTIGGYDISVYHVDDSKLQPKQGHIFPAYLPSSRTSSSQGILASWKDVLPIDWYYGFTTTVERYRRNELLLKHVILDRSVCKDPSWMESDTFYPKGTFCARDLSTNTCFDTGDSGSGFIKDRGDGKYSWEGSLSFYRGCDRYSYFSGYLGENPGVFSQGSCHLEWIATQYNLALSDGYSTDCQNPTGDPQDKDKTDCLAIDLKKPGAPVKCDFNTGLSTTAFSIGISTSDIPWDRCILCSEEGYVQPRFGCPINATHQGTCANNCLGVDASSIVVGGSALLAATAAGGLGSQALMAALGFGGVGVLGVGGLAMRGMCAGPLYCPRGNQCCLVVFTGPTIGYICPPSC